MRLALLLLLAWPAAAASPDASAPAVTPARPASVPALPATQPPPALPKGPGRGAMPDRETLRRDLAGVVSARARRSAADIVRRQRGAAARRSLAALKASLAAEQRELRRDRERALAELYVAPGAQEKRSWRLAAEAGAVLLEDCAAGMAAVDAARAAVRP